MKKCPHCDSEDIKAFALVFKKGQYIQKTRYRCKKCGRTWTERIRWEDGTYVVDGEHLQAMCKFADRQRPGKTFCSVTNNSPCRLQCLSKNLIGFEKPIVRGKGE